MKENITPQNKEEKEGKNEQIDTDETYPKIKSLKNFYFHPKN